MWRPNSLAEAPDVQLPTDKHGRTICPNCGARRPRAVIVDVRVLPIPEDWACDVCWTKWERQRRDIDGKGVAVDRRDWSARWVSALGAPAQVVSKFTERPS